MSKTLNIYSIKKIIEKRYTRQLLITKTTAAIYRLWTKNIIWEKKITTQEDIVFLNLCATNNF